MRTILFVCTGNTCRSPMAEAIARHWIGEGILGDSEEVFVASAGVFAADGVSPTPESIRILKDLGLDHHGRSKALTPEMVRRADLVFCMTTGHRDAVRELLGDDQEQVSKLLLLDESGDLEDPMGLGQEAYDALARRLMELIPRRLEQTLTA